MVANPGDLGRSLVFDLSSRIQGTILWGFHAVLSGAAILILCKRGLDSKPRIVQLIAITLIFIVTTMTMTVEWAVFIRKIQISLTEHPELSFGDYSYFSVDVYYLNRILSWLVRPGGLLYLIGDIIVLWRAWCLWTYRKVYLYFPLMLVVVSCMLCITFWGMTNPAKPQSEQRIFPTYYHFLSIMIVSLSFSVAANLITTFMIGYQAYHHRKAMQREFSTLPNRTWKILLYLTESGVVLCVVQMIPFILFLPPYFLWRDFSPAHLPLQYTREFWLKSYLYVSVSMPAIVVLMVTYQMTLADGSGVTGTPTGHLIYRPNGLHNRSPTAGSDGSASTLVSRRSSVSASVSKDSLKPRYGEV